MLTKYANRCAECHICSGGADTLFRVCSIVRDTDISNMNQSDNIFLYVSEGSLEITVGGLKPEILSDGKMLYIPSSVFFRGRALTDSKIVTCIFSKDMLSCSHYVIRELAEDLSYFEGKAVAYNILQAKPVVKGFFMLLEESLAQGLGCGGYHELKRKELVIMLLSLYTKDELYHLIFSSSGCKDNFKDFVLRNYTSIPDVKTFAFKANMSISTFQRWFKVEFGQLPGGWLKERRAELVLREILNTDKGFSVIAEEFGFSSASYFGTFCKQHFGHLPSELRPKKRKTEPLCRLR